MPIPVSPSPAAVVVGPGSEALAHGRAFAESRMVDTCTITHAGEGRGPFNEDTLTYDPPPRVTVYSGPCEVQRNSSTASDSDAVGGDWSSQPLIVKLPVVASESVARGHVVHIDTAANDQALVGRDLTVEALAHKTWATARRLGCTEGV